MTKKQLDRIIRDDIKNMNYKQTVYLYNYIQKVLNS